MKLETLKKLRNENNLTQKDIAKILNVERSTYAGWETEKSIIPVTKLLELSNYFKINIDYILGISKKKKYEFISKNIESKVIGENLKRLRIENNFKQKDIINNLNISKSTYSLYENGKIIPSTNNIYQIIKMYNCSFNELLKKKENG